MSTLLVVLYVLFLAGALTGAMTPCRLLWQNRKAAGQEPDAPVRPEVLVRRRRRVRS